MSYKRHLIKKIHPSSLPISRRYLQRVVVSETRRGEMAALYVNNNIMLLCTFVPWPTYPIDSITAEPPDIRSKNPAIFGRFLIENQLELTRYFSIVHVLTAALPLAALSRDNRSRILAGGIESSAPSIVERERQPVCVLFMTSANGARPCLTSAPLSLAGMLGLAGAPLFDLPRRENL